MTLREGVPNLRTSGSATLCYKEGKKEQNVGNNFLRLYDIYMFSLQRSLQNSKFNSCLNAHQSAKLRGPVVGTWCRSCALLMAKSGTCVVPTQRLVQFRRGLQANPNSQTRNSHPPQILNPACSIGPCAATGIHGEQGPALTAL